MLDLFPVLTDELEGLTGKKLLIANGVKNGKGTQRAVTTMGPCSLVGSRERVFLACGSREQREIRKGKLSILILHRSWANRTTYLVLVSEKLSRLFDSLETIGISRWMA